MDSLVKYSVQEICYEGAAGCNLNRFWEILDERLRKEKFTMTLDFHMRKYLFTLIKSHKYIAVKAPELDYEDEEFQKTTTLIATKSLFDKIFINDADITWTDGVKGIYLAIIKSREKGIFQSALNFGGEVNPKNVFHFLKPLEKAKLIEKIPVGGPDRGSNATNICLASRFFKNSDIYQSHKALENAKHITQTAAGDGGVSIRPTVSIFNKKVCSLLLNAPNRILFVSDMQNLLGFNTKALRKGFMGRMQKLMPEFVQMFYVVDPENPGSSAVRCFQLVKEYVEGNEEMLEIQHKSMNLTISPLLQVYHAILAAGDRGITTSELMAAIPFFGIKVLIVLLGQLSSVGKDGAKNGGAKYVSVVSENVGTAKVNRYYAIECDVAEIQRNDMRLIGFELPEFIEAPQISTPRLSNIKRPLMSSSVDATPASSVLSTPLGSPKNDEQPSSSLFQCKLCKAALDINVTDQDFSMEFCSKKCQDISYTADATGDSKLSAKKTRKTATSIQRQQYLRELLEIHKFLDTTGRNLPNKIRDFGISRNDKTIGKYQIDSKTIERMISTMKAANELKTVNVSFENFGGRSIVKRIICLPTANTDGLEFKAFVQSLREDAVLAKAMAPERKILEVSEKIQRFTQETAVKSKGGGHEGNVIAENYGYLFPRNLRMIALHNWLFEATTPDWATPIKERYVWKMVDTTAKMPIVVYLQCFGVRTKCPGLDRLLNDPHFNSSTAIKDLPTELRTSIINLHSFKTSFFALISMLELLELVVPLQKDQLGGYVALPAAASRKQLPTFYRISRRVPFFDFTVSPPLSELIVFNSQADIDSYWRETEKRYRSMSRNRFIPADFLFLARKKLWVYKRRYTDFQISGLISLIDPNSKATPIDNVEVCKGIAEELDLSLKSVRYFYENYDAYNPSSIERKRKRRKSNWYDDTSEDSDDSMGDNEFIAAHLGGESGSEDEYLERRISPFSPEDDTLLCLAAVVLNHFKGTKKPIHVLTQLFPSRDISKVIYRRRITYLRNKSGPKMKIDTLSSFWPEFLSYAKTQQNWLSGISDALLSSNFLGVVHAFRKFVGLKDPSFLPEDELSLPEFTDEFLFKDISVACDVGLDVRQARAAKQSFLNSIILSVPIGSYLDDFSYTHFDEKSKTVLLASAVIKMILAAPAEDYNAELAVKILKSFSENDLLLAIEKLKDCGAISKQQKVQPETRYMPGFPARGISLGEKFVAFFGRYLPEDFFKHAETYRRQLLQQGDKSVPQSNFSGSFACLYDMIVSGEVILEPHVPDLEYSMEEKDTSQTVSLKLEVPRSNSLVAIKRKEIDATEVSPSLKKRLEVVDKGKGPAIASDRHLLQIASLQNYNFDFVSRLYGTISDAESLGISYKELASDFDISPTNLDVCLKQMIIARLIDEVGFSHPRYIAHAYLDEWRVNFTSDIDGSVISFTPYVYSRFDGTLNTKVYRACCQSLLGIIAQKPGISFAGIFKRSKAVLNQIELRQLLEDLITHGVVRKTFVPAKIVEGPFDDLFEDAELSHSSCYFALRNFYTF